MHIHLRLWWKLVIKDRIDVFHVQSAGGNVGSYQYARTAIRESHQYLVSLRLIQITMQRQRDNLLALQITGYFGTIDAVMDADEEALQQVEDVGPVVAGNIRHFFDQEKNRDIVEKILLQGVSWPQADAAQQQQLQTLEGKTYVISGTLEGLSRDQAAKMLKARGARVSSSVSSKTTAVISGDNPGSKVTKAEELGVEILDQIGFENLLGGQE